MTVVAYVPDLMDRSKVGAAGGDAVRFVRSGADLVAAVTESGAKHAIVDLGSRGALEAVGSVAATTGDVRIIGFGRHTERELLAAASEAGCSEVLPRSEFFRRIGELLPRDDR